MKLSVIRFGCAVSATWALVLLLTGAANLIWPTYGVDFLKMMDGLYPGYHFGQWGFGGVLVMTLYGIIDAWLVGVIFAWLYNTFMGKKTQTP